MNKIQALHEFWSGFNWPAFDETSVPEEKERIALYGQAFPYLTYEVRSDEFGNDTAMTASIYDRTSSWKNITEKEMEISEAIGRGGKLINYDGGAFWIKKANPWAQRMGDEKDDKVRRIYFNVSIEFLD